MLKDIEIFSDPATWKPSKPIPANLLSLNGKRSINIANVFLHIAYRSCPPLSYGFSLGDMWAWLRYASALDISSDLKLRSEWMDIDPHQKTILSDDFGVGFSSYILSSVFDFLAVCPVNYFVDYVPSGFAKLRGSKSKKRGPKKSPDFIAVDDRFRIYIFECKGTQKTRDSLLEQFEKGKKQKRSLIINPRRLVQERLVTGAYIPQFNSKERAYFLVNDPEVSDGRIINDLPRDEIIKTIIIGEIASSINLIGLPTLGNAIASRTEFTSTIKKQIQEELNYRKSDIIIEQKYNIFLYEKIRFSDPNLANKLSNIDLLKGIEFRAGFNLDIIKDILNTRSIEEYVNQILKKEFKDYNNSHIQQKSDVLNMKTDRDAKVISKFGLYMDITELY